MLTCLEVILSYARRMTWRGQPPTVDHLAGEYRDGVRLTKGQMKPIEARLERSKTLPSPVYMDEERRNPHSGYGLPMASGATRVPVNPEPSE